MILYDDFFKLAFDTRHSSTERRAGITETELTIYTDATIEPEQQPPLAQALQALIGSSVVGATTSGESARISFDGRTIIVELRSTPIWLVTKRSTSWSERSA